MSKFVAALGRSIGLILVALLAHLGMTSHALAQTLSHIRIGGLSAYYHWDCRSPVITLYACADGGCSQRYTGGVTMNLALQRDGGPADGVGESFLPNGGAVSIPAGQSEVNVELNANVPGNWRLKMLSSTPHYNTLWCDGYMGSSCPMWVGHEVLYVGGAMPYTIPYAGYSGASEVAIVPSSTCWQYWSELREVPWEFSCEHLNPTVGYYTPEVEVASPGNGARVRYAMNAANNRNQACGGINTINVNMTGAANIWMRYWVYEDTGKLRMTFRHKGAGKKVGLDLSAVWDNVFLPSHFEFIGAPGGTIVAGEPLTMQLNAMAGSVVARSFGNEVGHVPPTVSFQRVAPTGAGASDGTATATLSPFVEGRATITNASWSEVGRGNFIAQLPRMLGQDWITSYYINTARGTTSRWYWWYGDMPLGPFIPASVQAVATPACGSYSYSGQAQQLTLRALNVQGQVTRNYDGSGALSPSFAHDYVGDVAFGAQAPTTQASIPLSSFVSGTSSTNQSIRLPVLPAPPSAFDLSVRTTGINASTGQPYVASATPANGTLRLGRLAMSDASAASNAIARIALEAQYWTGAGWARASDDSCTSLNATSFAPSSLTSTSGGAGSAVSIRALSFAGGAGYLDVNPPADGASTVATIAANLGTGAQSNSCIGSQPSATGAGAGHLRSNQACAPSLWTSDPAATVTFGSAQPRNAGDVWITDRR